MLKGKVLNILFSPLFDIFSLDMILKWLFCAIIIIVITTLVNVVYKYFKYGASVFPKVKRKEIIKPEVDIIINNLKKISGYRKIIKLKNFQTDLLIFDEKGILLLLYYNQKGTLVGNADDQVLKIKKGIDVFSNVSNPYKTLWEDEIRLIKILGEVEIKKYIVFNNDCNVQVNGFNNIKPVFLRNTDHVFRKELKQETAIKIDVDDYYNKFLVNNL